jgi:hypothetical protein
LCSTATVTVTIGVVNNPPTAGPVSISGPEDIAIPWTPAVTDDAVTSITCSITTVAAKGAASVASDCASGNYVPSANANGPDSFVYTVSDGVSTVSATVSVNVTAVPDAPVAADDTATTVKNVAVSIPVTANDSDPDGAISSLTIGLTQQPTGGSVSVGPTAGSVTYTPGVNFMGADTFKYQLCEGARCSNVATVTVTVTDNVATIEVRVSDSNDDNEEKDSGASRIRSSDLEMADDGGPQTVGIRFQNLQISVGSTITKAYIQFQTDEASAGATSLRVQVQNHANGSAFSNAKFDMSTRSWSAVSVPWTPADWTSVGASGTDQRTPDIKTLVQQLVSNPSWVNGNSAVFMITGTGRRVAESYDGSVSGAPLLHVEFSLGPTAGLSDQVGLLLLDSSLTRL